MTTHKIDDRRNIAIPGDKHATLNFCVKHFVKCANEAISSHGNFFVALSGGSTPKAIFQLLAKEYVKKVEWSKVHLFWSDERNVSPNDLESNYNMALRSGFDKIPVPKENIHRMPAEKDIEENAQVYEATIEQVLKGKPFDLVMLGMGEDGHTASLFPDTKGLKVQDKKVIANFIPQKNTWRMTFTFPMINLSNNIVIYVLGKSKADRLAEVLSETDESKMLPSAHVGTSKSPAFWIADEEAAAKIQL